MITPKRFIYFAFVHIILILIVCTSSTIDAYEKSTSFRKNSFTDILGKFKKELRGINSLPILSEYEAIGGINAGYGFFAPNVASSYILKITVKNKSTGEIRDFYYPPFKTKEGLNRYHTLLGYFQDRLTILENGLSKKTPTEFKQSDKYSDYLDIFIKSIGRFYYKNYSSEKYNVACTLYLYDAPSLAQSSVQKKQPVLIQLLAINVSPIKK